MQNSNNNGTPVVNAERTIRYTSLDISELHQYPHDSR